MKLAFSLLTLTFLSLLLLTQCIKPQPKTHYLTLGTGPLTGLYYATGITLAECVNTHSTTPDIDLSVETSEGSKANIKGLSDGDLTFALTQADTQYQAYHGLGEWKGNPQKKLRFICSLNQEALTLIAANDSHINTLKDLLGKRISIGSPDSGTQNNALQILRQKGIDPTNDLTIETLTLNESIKKFKNGQIDAFFMMAGHPNPTILEITNNPRQPAHFIPIDKMRALVKDSPYYTKTFIPIYFYPKVTNTQDVPTIGTLTTLLTSEEVSDEIVYQVIQLIYDNLEKLKTKHPSFTNLSRKNLLEGAFSPIHPGAKKFYDSLKPTIGT